MDMFFDIYIAQWILLDLHLVMVLLHSHWYKDGIRLGTLFAGIDFLCCLGQT